MFLGCGDVGCREDGRKEAAAVALLHEVGDHTGPVGLEEFDFRSAEPDYRACRAQRRQAVVTHELSADCVTFAIAVRSRRGHQSQSARGRYE